MGLKEKREFGRVGVLMGGVSTEREISLKSGKQVYQSLSKEIPDLLSVDIKSEDAGRIKKRLKSSNIDVAFIALHGRFGEDGGIQSILESLSIPYTGSGVKASKLAMDKVASHRIFQEQGLRVPDFLVFKRSKVPNHYMQDIGRLGFPLVVKPAAQGSSIGLSIIDEQSRLTKAIEAAFSFDQRIIIEEYVKGREMTVGILDQQALPVIEIIPKKRFFDYEAKYSSGMSEYVVPAKINEKNAKALKKAALLAHQSLGCSGFSRVDMILKNDQAFVLEVNTIPGLTEISLLPKAAASVGISFSQLCIRLIEIAYQLRRKA